MDNPYNSKQEDDPLQSQLSNISQPLITQTTYKVPPKSVVKKIVANKKPEFGQQEFNGDELDRIKTALQKKLTSESIETRPGPNGCEYTYVASGKAIELANETFDFNGWSCKIIDLTADFLDETPEGFRCGYSAVVKIILKDGTHHEDVGFGCKLNPNRALAIENAKKEAVTDARKRALRLFGNRLGNCLYDKEYSNKVKADFKRQQQQPSQTQPSQIQSQPGTAPLPNQPSQMPPIKTEPGITQARPNIPQPLPQNSAQQPIQGQFHSNQMSQSNAPAHQNSPPSQLATPQQKPSTPQPSFQSPSPQQQSQIPFQPQSVPSPYQPRPSTTPTNLQPTSPNGNSMYSTNNQWNQPRANPAPLPQSNTLHQQPRQHQNVAYNQPPTPQYMNQRPPFPPPTTQPVQQQYQANNFAKANGFGNLNIPSLSESDELAFDEALALAERSIMNGKSPSPPSDECNPYSPPDKKRKTEAPTA